MKNINKVFIIIGVVGFCILVGVVVYKMVIEPAQLKKIYTTCVEDAKKTDYARRQDFEKQIAEKDELVKKITAEADTKWNEFLKNNKNEDLDNRTLNKTMKASVTTLDRSLAQQDFDFGDLFNDSNKKLKKEEIYKKQRQLNSELYNLHKQRNSSGQILEEKLKECEKQYKLFK